MQANLLTDALEKLGDVGLAAVRGVADAFADLVEHTVNVGNSLYEMSLKTGASVENLSALRYVASQTGIDFDSFGTTLYKMEQALGSSGAKADALQGQLDKLGLSMADLKNESPDQAFIDIMSALEEMPNRADQAAIGMALFGKGFKEMAGLTQESITGLIQEAQDLGLVMGTDQAAAAHAAEVGWKSFTMQLESAAMSVASVVLPGLIALEQLASDAFGALVKGWTTASSAAAGDQMRAIMVQIGEGLIATTATLAGFVRGALDGFGFIVDGAIRLVQAVINVGDAFLTAAKAAAFLTGDAALKAGIAVWESGLKGVYNATVALKGGFDATVDVTKNVFTTVESVADSMSGKFGAAYDAVSGKVADYAAKSKAAWGGAGTDIDTGKDKVDRFGQALDDMNSAGSNWHQTLLGIDGEVVAAVRYYLDAGVSAATLKEVYGLTDVQIQALKKDHEDYAATLKMVQGIEDAKNQNSMEWIKRLGGARTVDSLESMHDTVASIQQTQQLWTQYYDTLATFSLSNKDKQIANVQKWFDDEVLKLKEDDQNWLAHYDALYAVAHAKMDQIQKLNDPFYLAQKKLQDDSLHDWNKFLEDVYGGFSKTFSVDIVKALTGQGGFSDVWHDLWKMLETDVTNILADLLNNVIQGFINGAETKLGGWLAGLVFGSGHGGSGGSGGGGGLLGLISGLFGGGGGDTNSPWAGETPASSNPLYGIVPGIGNGSLPPGSAPGDADLGLSTGGMATALGIEHFAFGGFAQGTDTIPAMLSPGEGVLNVSDMAALGGPAGFSTLRASLHGSGGGDTLENTTIVTLDGEVLYRMVERKQATRLHNRRKLAAA